MDDLVGIYLEGGASGLNQVTVTVSLGETEENRGKSQNNGPSSISMSCKSNFYCSKLCIYTLYLMLQNG